jgi:hypothetical protein
MSERLVPTPPAPALDEEEESPGGRSSPLKLNGSGSALLEVEAARSRGGPPARPSCALRKGPNRPKEPFWADSADVRCRIHAWEEPAGGLIRGWPTPAEASGTSSRRPLFAGSQLAAMLGFGSNKPNSAAGATGLEPAASGVTVGWSATVEFRIPTTIPPLRPITKRRSGYANLCVACTSFRPKRRSWAFSSDPASIDVGGSAQDARLAPECEGDPGRDWRYRRSSRASEISASPRLPCRCPEHQRRRHLRDACIPRKGAKPGWRLEPGASGGRFSPLPPL